MLSRNQPLPNPDNIPQAVLAEVRPIFVESNNGITTTQLRRFARQSIRKLLDDRQISEIVIENWVKAVEHALKSNQHAGLGFGRVGSVLTAAGLEALSIKPDLEAGFTETAVVV